MREWERGRKIERKRGREGGKLGEREGGRGGWGGKYKYKLVWGERQWL